MADAIRGGVLRTFWILRQKRSSPATNSTMTTMQQAVFPRRAQF